MRTEPHPSFQNVMNATLAGNKGQFMAPAQLAELAEAQIAAQAAQQAAVQQAAAAQAAQAAQAAALPAPPPMAGPPMSPAQLAQQVGSLSCQSLLGVVSMPTFHVDLGVRQGPSACQACRWSIVTHVACSPLAAEEQASVNAVLLMCFMWNAALRSAHGPGARQRQLRAGCCGAGATRWRRPRNPRSRGARSFCSSR